MIVENDLTRDNVEILSPKKVSLSRDRAISQDLIDSATNPLNNDIGEPSGLRPNAFLNLSITDFDISAEELNAWEKFSGNTCKYGFTKSLFQQLNLALPGFKTFSAIAISSTEMSEITPVTILDEAADKKETVLKVLNKLYEKFQIGVKSKFVVVVGDGKSYDHMIKLKGEYGESLHLVLPYPGDWHIMKNVLPVFIKIYFDACHNLSSRVDSPYTCGVH